MAALGEPARELYVLLLFDLFLLLLLDLFELVVLKRHVELEGLVDLYFVMLVQLFELGTQQDVDQYECDNRVDLDTEQDQRRVKEYFEQYPHLEQVQPVLEYEEQDRLDDEEEHSHHHVCEHVYNKRR